MAKKMNFTRPWRKYLRQEIGKEREEIFLSKVKNRFTELIALEESTGNKVLDRYKIDNILPVLAAYQIYIETGFSKEEALQKTNQLLNSAYIQARKRVEFAGKFSFFYALIQKMTPSIMAKEFPAPGFEIEWIEVSNHQVAFNMKSCFYQKTLSDLNAPELTSIFCDLDDFLYKDVSPYMRFERSQTLGKGGTHCDFHFRRVLPSKKIEVI